MATRQLYSWEQNYWDTPDLGHKNMAVRMEIWHCQIDFNPESPKYNANGQET